MPGQSRVKLGEALELLLNKLSQRPNHITTYALSEGFKVPVHTAHLRLRTPVKNQKLDFDCAINSVSVMPDLKPRIKSRSADFDAVRVYNWTMDSKPVQVSSFEPLADWSTAVLGYSLWADPQLTCMALPPANDFNLRTKSFPMATAILFDKRPSLIKTAPENLFHMTTAVHASPTTLKDTIKDGTELSIGLRIRRRSVRLYRLSLEVLDGYFREIVRQKRIRAEDTELVGIFIVPSTALQSMTIDVERRSLYYRLAAGAGRHGARHTLIVARDKSTGTLHAVFEGAGNGGQGSGAGGRGIADCRL